VKFLQVATFSWPDHYGGAERVIGEVSKRLVSCGHEVTLLTSRLSGLPATEERDGVSVRRYEVDRSSPTRFYRSVFVGLRRLLKDPALRTADVVHLHQLLSGVAALAPGGVGRRPTLFSFYAPYHREFLAGRTDGREQGDVGLADRAVSALLRSGDRYLLRRADRVLVLSNFSRSQIRSLHPEALERTTLTPPGVDMARFRPAGNEAERLLAAEQFGLPAAGGPIVLSVRRLVPRMGLSDLVEAARLLASRGSAFHLVIAGEGPAKEELEQQVHDAELGDRVSLLGRVDDDRLPELYRAADVFVLPTRSLEGFGMATAEALASGLPIVATDAGANAELLSGLDGSALVRAEDPADLAEALGALLSSEARRATAGRATRSRAEQRLDWEPHIAAVVQAARDAGAVR
jgi:glycosyltransferase involved in cell wall biosynthesis